MRLAGAVALVTGGASGLGAGTARMLAECGARVVVMDRDGDRGRAVAAEIGGLFAEVDVADADQVAAAVELATGLGALRVLVNCAGISRARRTVSREGPFELDQFEATIRTNLVGTFNCIRLAATAMAELPAGLHGERGAIVNTSSSAAFEGQVGQAAYAASKAGVAGMTLPIARDLATLGIRVNTIAPGMFDTPIFGEGARAETFKRRLEPNLIFPKRAGEVAEFASLVREMLTNAYFNGEVVRLDGAARLAPR